MTGFTSDIAMVGQSELIEHALKRQGFAVTHIALNGLGNSGVFSAERYNCLLMAARRGLPSEGAVSARIQSLLENTEIHHRFDRVMPVFHDNLFHYYEGSSFMC